MLRSLLAVCLGVAVVAAGRGDLAKASARPAPVGSVDSASQVSRLLGFANGAIVRIDPGSLQALPGPKIPVGSGGCAARDGGTACWSVPPWTVSPDGKRVAVARNNASSVELIDPTRVRVLARIPIGGGSVGALTWLTRNRLIALQEIGGERQRLLVLDLATRRVVARHPLGGSVQQLAVAGNRLVLLLSPAQSIGPARIAIADAAGALRFVRLGQIRAGSHVLGTGSTFAIETQLPGLAVDPIGGHAFVIDENRVAEVDLAHLGVSYHALLNRRPAAATKEISGHQRDAHWLGDGLLAVSGSNNTRDHTQPAGLLLIDTSNWSVRTFDPDATGFELAGNLLLATGERAESGRAVGIGIAAYAFDGGKRFRVLDGQPAWLELAYGGRAYVGVSGQNPLTIVDLKTGAVAGKRTLPLPTLLLGRGAGWWKQSISP
jgi:DNA-binding beta-propeller fold protein YncE